MTDWIDGAACAEIGPDLFFPDTGERSTNRHVYRDALTICETCPVATQCLEHALTNDERYGVWGGTTPNEREQMRSRRGLLKPATRDGMSDVEFLKMYDAHLAAGQPLADLAARLGYASADSIGNRAATARRRLGQTPPVNQWAARTHCIHGHEFAGDNLIVEAGGRRRCRTCQSAKGRRQRQKARQQREAS